MWAWIVFLRRVRKIAEKKAIVRIPVWDNFAFSGRIFMKFDI